MAPPKDAATLDSRAASQGGAVRGSLVSTKLRAPTTVGGHGERPRLSALLDRGLEDSTRLTLLSAPPGYGKTVAVVGWLQSRGVAYAWLSLDAADNDLSRFTRYLSGALGTVRPAAADATADFFGPGANPGPDLVGATLLEALAARDDPFVLVLDDYQLVTAEPIHRLVRFLIERGPPFVHLVLLTREDPPLPLARLRGHGRLVELRADDLRWRTDEASTYLGSLGVSLAPPLVERLVERTEGWIAGLQLAAISLRDRPDPAALIEMFGGSQRFVFDYLADEALGGADEDLRAFLVRTSIAERFTAELCRELTGRTDADALLERAERANLFIVPLDAERRWYRYHRLFADYLRAQLGPDERRELHERAADCLERMGFESDAIDHALAAGSLDRATRLIERAARPAFESGELATLLGWFEALPADRVAQSPDLVSLHAWALFETGQMGAAVALAERHLASSDAHGPAEGRLLVLRALMATVTGPDAESLALEGLKLVGDDPLFRSLGLLAAGLATLARGEYVAAVATLRVGYQTALLQAGNPTAVLPAVSPLGQALALAGLRGEAETICRAVLAQQADGQGRPRPIAWPARVVLGIVRYEANDLAEARRELEAGFEAARRMGIGRPVLGWAISYLALVRLADGDHDAAFEALRTSQRDLRTTGMALPGLAGEIEARILLWLGDVAGAGRWADRATPEAPPGSPLLEILRRSMDTTIARVRLAQGKPDEARELLARTRVAQEASGAVADLISIGVLEAAVADATGRRAEAVQALRQAVELAAPGGYVRRFVDDGRSIAHLLSLVRTAAPAFVDVLMAAFEAEPTEGRAPELHVAGTSVWQGADGRLLETLTARELDVLLLMAQGASNAEIASGLTVSLGTAKWHVGHVLAKLGATSRTQALLRAQQVGLV